MSAATRARAGSDADRTTQLIEEAADAFTDEVVTRALIRDVQLPGGAGTLALITLDNGFDHSRPTTFGPRGLLDLDAALDRLAGRAVAGEIVAVGLTGKPFVFAVGADLGMMSSGLARGPDREAALAVGRMGHRAFRRLGELGVPSFAYVNGAALGGGLEIALHCTYRTMSSGATAIGLPECFLGLLPGWGGCHLLPNLIGPAGALEVIITNPLNQNRMIDARRAMALGIADALFEPADFLEESLAWTGRVLAGKTGVGRAEIDRSAEAWEAATGPVTAMVDLKLHGAAPAPYRAIELVRLARTADATTAFEAEDEAAADLATGEELRAGLYAFDLVNKRAKRPAGAPSPALARPVGMVGIVGAGLMAGQLALLFARRLQVPVVMTDLDQARVDRGVGYVHGEIDTLLARGRIGADAANRLKGLVTGTTDRAAFAGADLVLEAVFEQMATKRQVLAEMEEVVGPECVLMTNTSSLSVTAMAAGLAHPERVVGFHFFNPVAVLPLVEVVRGEQTDDPTLATAFAVGKQLRKSCVLVRDAPAFVVNRLLTRFLGEIIAAVDGGTPPLVADRALDPIGLPMSPFTLLALVGPAVALHVAETMHEAFPDRFAVSENLRRLVGAGRTSVWSYDAGGKPYLPDDVAALIEQGDEVLTERQVADRALAALAQEIRIMLDDGVVLEAQDVDLCLLLGAGWPFHLGGITPYLDREGISERVTGRRFGGAG